MLKQKTSYFYQFTKNGQKSLLTLTLAQVLMCFTYLSFSQIQTSNAVECFYSKQNILPQTTSSSAGNNFNLIHVTMNLFVDPDTLYLQGKCNYLIKSISNIDTLQFDLSSSLSVDSVKYHNSLIAFSHSLNVLSVPLPTTIPISTCDSVKIYYQGTPSNSGFGSFIKTSHSGTNIIWTLSEPYGASDWWPCKNSLIDKVDSLDMIITTPNANRVASNGILINEITNGSFKTYHWKTTYPTATYLIAIAVTNYASYYDYFIKNTDTLRILNYVYPENLSSSQIQSAEIAKIFHLYDSLLIPYPFSNEKYGHAQFSWGGGMEHQTMSFVSNFSEPLMAHELAHQWFGDMITCGSWEDIWLNEGFATYMEGLVKQHFHPEDWKLWKENKLNTSTSAVNGSVLCSDTTNVSRIFSGQLSYSKGAYVLHMLRWILGDSIFFQSLKNYLSDPTLKYNFAKTPLLINHFEQTSGKNLQSFFNQWYYGEGYPSYTLKWGYANGEITIIATQTTSHTSVPFFAMPIPVYIKGAANKDTTLILNNTHNEQTFTHPLHFIPTDIQFDPELWILSDRNIIERMAGLNNEDNRLLVYPSPTNDIITIELLQFYEPITTIIITNTLGEICFQKELTTSEFKVSVNISPFLNGVYYLRANTLNNSSVKKIMKQ